MKYEHKTVGMNWFDAADRLDGRWLQTNRPNLGDGPGWHVVGTIGGNTGDPQTKMYFIMERVVGDGERET